MIAVTIVTRRHSTSESAGWPERCCVDISGSSASESELRNTVMIGRMYVPIA